jgi:hypothetical protein
MKIPVCPKCREEHTLKLVDCLTGGGLISVAVIRCMKTSGGCGEVFTVAKLVVIDSSGLVTELYQDEESFKRETRFRPKRRGSMLSNIPLRERKP